ncbi:DUF2934 domain-containing protein [Rhizobium lusitanum]|uniref:DUF2934 domain-containing protein n=2 Tax=Rhizobium lusitanum TaxID=293958 RepID=A0A6L9U4E2_9HYPH|nr:DUF2934 domain-containing protein [Rhizobium lusitanum]NEI69050.1 DUF2934 domain-containing protein [Rhizobium lusitanum]
MLESRDEWIKKRAYAIWEEEGHPYGRDVDHWHRASGERFALEESVTTAGKIEVKPKAKRKTVIAAAAAADEVAAKPAAKKASKKATAAKA